MFKDPVIFLMHRIFQAKTEDGQTLIEKMEYRGVAMWWFVDYLYIYLFLSLLIESSGNIEKVNLESLTKNSKKYSVRKRKSFFYNSFFIYDVCNFVTSILCRIIIRSYKKSNKDSHNRNKILFTAENIEWRRMKDHHTKKTKKTDIFFDSILSKFKKNNKSKIISLYPLSHPFQGLLTVIDKRINQKNIIHYSLDACWSFEIWKNGRRARKHFLKVWEELKKDSVFRESLKYNGVDMFKLLEEELSYCFNVVFSRMVDYLEMSERFLENEKPDLILIKEENGQFERALILAAKKQGIPTIAIEHGVACYITNYIACSKDKKLQNKCVKLLHNFMPDKTAVYGSYNKYAAIGSGLYPRDSIVVTGHPRYDILCDADKIYSKEKFIKKYNINPKHKIILWLTQCHSLTDEENVNNFRIVFNAIQSLENTSIIIKQHPNEHSRYTRMIKKYLKNYKINLTLISKNSDTFEQLFVSDLVFSKSSTSVVEAVALGKPVIILNFGKNSDILDYVGEGIARGVYREKDLLPTIEKLLKDDLDLAKNRRKFIERYLYKIDGEAAKRVEKLIEKIINKSKAVNI